MKVQLPIVGPTRGDDTSDRATPRATTVVIASADGTVTFSLSDRGHRLFVQRAERKVSWLVAVQCLMIDDAEDFSLWCDTEPVRFQHPVVFDRLKRYGDEVFSIDR